MSRLARGLGRHSGSKGKNRMNVSVWSYFVVFIFYSSTKISPNVHKSIERAVDIFRVVFLFVWVASARALVALATKEKTEILKAIKDCREKETKLKEKSEVWKELRGLKYGDNIKFIIWVRNQNMKIFCFAFCWTWKMLKTNERRMEKFQALFCLLAR